jgi:hypothetical protein
MGKGAEKVVPLELAKLNIRTVWLRPEFLDWDASPESSSVNDRIDYMRAHELLLHAERRLNLVTSREDRADVIAILRRVLNHRLQKLKGIYLENVPISKKASGTIEQLALLGVVKPLMLHKLLQIRNAIEYQDSKPPSLKQCAELLEFMWYFLRSTDVLVRLVLKSISFSKLDKHGKDTPYGFTLQTGPEDKWQSKISGWFEPKDVSLSPKPDWVKIEVETVHTKHEQWPNSKYHSDKKKSDIWIIGRLASPVHLDRICRVYFSHSVG